MRKKIIVKVPVVRRTDLERLFAADAGLHAEDGRRLLAVMLKTVQRCLLDRKSVCLGRVGRLNVHVKAARIARNPRHPEDEVFIPAHWSVCFVPRKPLRSALRRIEV